MRVVHCRVLVLVVVVVFIVLVVVVVVVELVVARTIDQNSFTLKTGRTQSGGTGDGNEFASCTNMMTC